MPNTAPVGVATTVVMAVDSTSLVSLYSGGDKISEQAINPLDPPLTVDTLSFGATDPGKLQPGSFLLEQISLWSIPLIDQYGQIYSGDLNWTEPVENAPKPVVSIPATLSVKEGDTLQIPVTKSGPGACTVQLRTIGREATTPGDYAGFLSPVTFGVNDTVVYMPLSTVADAPGTDAGDETLRLELSLAGSTDATLGTALCVVTITEPPRISVPPTTSVREGDVLSLIVSKAGTGACSVTWRTLSGTGPTGATVASGDYTGVSATTLNFGASETQKTVNVTTLPDATAEVPETFSVLLENPTGCSITTGTCTVTILDPNAPEVPEQTALSTAVGFASSANCGEGYEIYKVTTLEDSGTGSLRAGCALGKRMIVFEVAGRIALESTLRISANTTIAGETAPAPGITIQKKEFYIRASNVRISHICFERGYDKVITLHNGVERINDNNDCGKVVAGSNTGLTPTTYSNIHFYHCAFYWAMDETVELWPSGGYRIDGLSFHDCIFAEPLRWPASIDLKYYNHWKVEPESRGGGGLQSQHNYGLLIGYNSRRVDLQYCLFTDMDWRAPFVDHSTSVVVANCIANNCTKGVSIFQNSSPTPATFTLTVKGYLCISGPNTGTSGTYTGLLWHNYKDPQPDNTKVFAEKLYGWRGGPADKPYRLPDDEVVFAHKDANGNQIPAYWLDGTTKVPCMVNTPPIDTPTPTVALEDQALYDRAMLNVGPRPKEIRKLIAGDMTIGNKDIVRSLNNLKNKTGRWPNHEIETQIGGFYAPVSVSRPFTSTQKFPDGTLIGLPPAGADPPTTAGRAAQRAWLRKHLDQVQND